MKFFRRIGEWYQRIHHQGGVLRVDTFQDQKERALIIERNHEVRATEALRDLTFGRCVASIPIEDYYSLVEKYPDLKAFDRQTRERAWQRFLTSSEARPFLTNDTASGRY